MMVVFFFEDLIGEYGVCVSGKMEVCESGKVESASLA